MSLSLAKAMRMWCIAAMYIAGIRAFPQSLNGMKVARNMLARKEAQISLRRLLQEQGGADDDVSPAPPSIGTDVPLTYFGPAPSQVDPRLIGPYQLLKSGVLDLEAGTITLPLYYGYIDEGDDNYPVWYVVTDTDDAANAAALGINHSPKLTYADTSGAARSAELVNKDGMLMLRFEGGKVDFEPKRVVEPGEAPDYFPPVDFKPGSVGDKAYSPLVKVTNAGARVYNAPIVAGPVSPRQLNKYCDGVREDDMYAYTMLHDRVTAVCVDEDTMIGTVTLSLVPGHSFARPVLYISTDSNDEMAAAMEMSTWAPALGGVSVGADDSLFSAVERIFAITNGYTNGDVNAAEQSGGPGERVHPSRQGFNSALRGDGPPLNTLGGIPTIATDYSPLWDVNVGEWTPYAVANGYRVRLLEEFQILGLVERGFITGPGGGEYGSSGIIVNCPIVHRFL